jgi:hypothetical protein
MLDSDDAVGLSVTGYVHPIGLTGEHVLGPVAREHDGVIIGTAIKAVVACATGQGIVAFAAHQFVVADNPI